MIPTSEIVKSLEDFPIKIVVKDFPTAEILYNLGMKISVFGKDQKVLISSSEI